MDSIFGRGWPLAARDVVDFAAGRVARRLVEPSPAFSLVSWPLGTQILWLSAPADHWTGGPKNRETMILCSPQNLCTGQTRRPPGRSASPVPGATGRPGLASRRDPGVPRSTRGWYQGLGVPSRAAGRRGVLAA